MSKGWRNDKQRHSMAKKGIRTANLKAKGTRTYGEYSGDDFSIDEHYWGLEKNGDSWRLRLGNWTDAGWHWSGEESEFAGFLIRIGSSRIDDFVEIMKDMGVDYKDLKELIVESAKSGDGVYMLTGDNAKWHFSQDGEPEYDIIRYQLRDDEKLTDKEVSDFEDYYFSNADAKSTQFGAFAESEHYSDVKDAIVEAVESADDWEEALDNLKDARSIGEEASFEYSDNAIYSDVMEKYNTWKEERFFTEQEGIPSNDIIEMYVNKFGKVKAINQLQKNFPDLESKKQAEHLVTDYQIHAIKTGTRTIDAGQKRLLEY